MSITYDPVGQQLLSPMCHSCRDAYFRPSHHRMFNVGCCSHSPVYTLLELHALAVSGRDFFYESLYFNKNRTIQPYAIVIHADIHPGYEQIVDASIVDPLVQQDLQLQYAVCQFFAPGSGCSLPASRKTSVCRGFICTTIEESLLPDEAEGCMTASRTISQEAREFNRRHEQILRERKVDLLQQPDAVLDYLETVMR